VNRYIPLERLFNHFYFEQHEIGYLQAGALIAFMTDTWGWKEFSAFYRDIHQTAQSRDGSPPAPAPGAAPTGSPPEDKSPSHAVDVALRAHFGLTLEQLEARFIEALRQERASPADAEDVRLTVLFYDTARRYQQTLDPSAHFLTAWLLDNDKMRKNGIVADYLRHPSQPENLALETMLAAANQNLIDGNFAPSLALLDAANQVLDRYPAQGLDAFAAVPLASDHLALVQTALADGYQPQRIELNTDGTARMWVTTPRGPQLVELSFVRQPSGWSLY